MKLDLGSGFHPYRPEDPTWLHLDANPNAPHVEYALNAFDPLPFNDGEVEELRACDILEHQSYWHTDETLAEWARVLRPGGSIYVQVPDAHEIMRRYIVHQANVQALNGTEDAKWVDEAGLLPPRGLPQTGLAGAAWRILGGMDDGKYVERGGDWSLNVHRSLWSALSLRQGLEVAGFQVLALESNPHPNLCCRARRA